MKVHVLQWPKFFINYLLVRCENQRLEEKMWLEKKMYVGHPFKSNRHHSHIIVTWPCIHAPSCPLMHSRSASLPDHMHFARTLTYAHASPLNTHAHSPGILGTPLSVLHDDPVFASHMHYKHGRHLSFAAVCAEILVLLIADIPSHQWMLRVSLWDL